MVEAAGPLPLASGRVQAKQEACGVIDIFSRVERLIEAGKGIRMEEQVHLHATNVD